MYQTDKKLDLLALLVLMFELKRFVFVLFFIFYYFVRTTTRVRTFDDMLQLQPLTQLQHVCVLQLQQLHDIKFHEVKKKLPYISSPNLKMLG